MNTQPLSSEEPIREYLAFKLGAHELGVDIQQVESVLAYTQYVARNRTDSLVDLRARNSTELVRSPGPVLVLVLSKGEERLGLAVNEVNDVIALAPYQLHTVSEDSPVDSSLLLAEGVSGARTFLLIDFEKLHALTARTGLHESQTEAGTPLSH